jgi:hypothetical protein
MRDDILKVSGTTARQRARWREAAGGGTRDLSAWIRDVADEATNHAGPRVGWRQSVDGLAASLAELRGALGSGPGNTLNQVARALNTAVRAGQAPDAAPHERSLAEAHAEIGAIRAALNAALDRLDELRP